MRLSHCFCLCLIVLPPYSSIQFIFIPTMSLFRSPWCPRDRLNQLWDWGGPGPDIASGRARVWSVTMLLSDRWPGPGLAPLRPRLRWVSSDCFTEPEPLTTRSLFLQLLYILVSKRKLNQRHLKHKHLYFSVSQCWIFVKIWVHWHCREHDRGHSLEWFCTRYFCASLWMFSGVQDIVTLLTKYFGASRGIVS